MGWIKAIKSSGHITEALIHFNQAIKGLGNEWSMVEVSRSLFDALNKIQTEWVLCESAQKMGEVKTFQAMILNALDSQDHINFLQSTEISNLVFYEPQIMNHNTLRRHRYRPDLDIEPQLVKKASEEHHKVVTAFNEYFPKKNNEVKERLMIRIAELLYIVRSNIAHGEKTPYGPDLKKKERDEQVCSLIIPVQRLILNTLFGHPECKLVVYGTLAPGKVNHHIISEIPGSWKDCIVNGHVDEANGLPYFSWEPRGPSLKAQLFTSSVLPSMWKEIDNFEGPSYQRILIPVKIIDEIDIANIYVTTHNLEARKWRR